MNTDKDFSASLYNVLYKQKTSGYSSGEALYTLAMVIL